jgi:hypothetical protein
VNGRFLCCICDDSATRFIAKKWFFVLVFVAAFVLHSIFCAGLFLAFHKCTYLHTDVLLHPLLSLDTFYYAVVELP